MQQLSISPQMTETSQSKLFKTMQNSAKNLLKEVEEINLHKIGNSRDLSRVSEQVGMANIKSAFDQVLFAKDNKELLDSLAQLHSSMGNVSENHNGFAEVLLSDQFATDMVNAYGAGTAAAVKVNNSLGRIRDLLFAVKNSEGQIVREPLLHIHSKSLMRDDSTKATYQGLVRKQVKQLSQWSRKNLQQLKNDELNNFPDQDWATLIKNSYRRKSQLIRKLIKSSSQKHNDSEKKQNIDKLNLELLALESEFESRINDYEQGYPLAASRFKTVARYFESQPETNTTTNYTDAQKREITQRIDNELEKLQVVNPQTLAKLHSSLADQRIDSKTIAQIYNNKAEQIKNSSNANSIPSHEIKRLYNKSMGKLSAPLAVLGDNLIHGMRNSFLDTVLDFRQTGTEESLGNLMTTAKEKAAKKALNPEEKAKIMGLTNLNSINNYQDNNIKGDFSSMLGQVISRLLNSLGMQNLIVSTRNLKVNAPGASQSVANAIENFKAATRVQN